MLARPAPGGFELFMVRRSAKAAFAPDAFVFPGGTQDPHDASIEDTAMRELFEEAGVQLPGPEALVRFSHWITPPSEARRYDTHFFLAVAPPDQIARADASETHDGVWISPARALARFREGSMHLVYPTIKHLERLLPFESIDAVINFALSKPIVTIVPDPAPGGDGFVIAPELEHAW
jgi:8-oxo-dGTP pyrophosphatase MutT (NUDIX family)